MGYRGTRKGTETMGGWDHVGESLEGEEAYLRWLKDRVLIPKSEMGDKRNGSNAVVIVKAVGYVLSKE